MNNGNLHFKLGTHFFSFHSTKWTEEGAISPVERFVFGQGALPEHTEQPSLLLAASTDWMLVFYHVCSARICTHEPKVLGGKPFCGSYPHAFSGNWFLFVHN